MIGCPHWQPILWPSRCPTLFGARRLLHLSSACETIGRACFAMELEPALVDVAVRRWEAFTGKKAALLSNGRLFEAVAAERLAAPEGVREPRKGPTEQNHPE